MKKLPFITNISLLLAVIGFGACTDENINVPPESLQPTTVELIRKQIKNKELSLPDMRKGWDKQSRAATADLKFSPEGFTIDWKNYQMYKEGDKTFWLFPMKTKETISGYVHSRMDEKTIRQATIATFKLLVVQCGNKGTGRIITYIPERKFFKNKKNTVSNLGHDLRGTCYSGLFLLSHLNGEIIGGNKFNEGTILYGFYPKHAKASRSHHHSECERNEHERHYHLYFDFFAKKLTRAATTYSSAESDADYCSFCNKPVDDCECLECTDEYPECPGCGYPTNECWCCPACNSFPCVCNVCNCCGEDPCVCGWNNGWSEDNDNFEDIGGGGGSGAGGSSSGGSSGNSGGSITISNIEVNAAKMCEQLNKNQAFKKKILDLGIKMYHLSTEDGWLVTADGRTIEPSNKYSNSLTFNQADYSNTTIVEFTHGHHALGTNVPSFQDFKTLSSFYSKGFIGENFIMVLTTPEWCTMLTINNEAAFKDFCNNISKDQGTIKTWYEEQLSRSNNFVNNYNILQNLIKNNGGGIDISYTNYNVENSQYTWGSGLQPHK